MAATEHEPSANPGTHGGACEGRAAIAAGATHRESSRGFDLDAATTGDAVDLRSAPPAEGGAAGASLPAGGKVGAAIVLAALALPGLQSAAQAEEPPARGEVALRYLYYKDSQPDLDRVTVRAPSLSIIAPIAEEWSIAASAVTDSVSGASPRWHTARSGASRMDDNRSAADVQITRYFPRGALTVGTTYSTEHDYESRAFSVTGRVSSDDNNTTWSFGVGSSNDEINPTNNAVRDERKRTVDFLVGVARVLTPDDVVSLDLTHARGRGYFTDPYKFPDNRPRSRDQTALLARWNHFVAPTEGTLRLGYRYYADDWGVRAHTLSSEYHQPFAGGWALVPSLRFHTQRAAEFYYDPVYDAVLGEPFPPGYVFGSDRHVSADQRLSAFGGLTVGLKVIKQFGRDWTVDLKYERYEQRGDWRVFGDGSPGLATFRAHMVQAGIAWKW